MRTSQMSDREFAEFVKTHPVSGGKGSDSAKSIRDQEMKMNKQAFDTQQKMIAQLTKSFSPFLSGTKGFDPSAMAGMQSQFLNSNDSTFNQAGQQVREALGARGDLGSNPVGGSFARGLSSLLGAKAGSQSQGLLGLQIQNALQGQNNMWNAGNILSGNAATLTGTQGVQANAMSNALNQFMNAENSGFGASFMSSFGKGLGGLAGTAVGGGLGKGLGF